MRVTNQMMINTFIRTINDKSGNLLKLQEMISSGKRITRSSEDPMAMSKIAGFRKTLCAIDQYGRNIAHGKSWLSTASSTLGQVDELLIRVKELAVSQATETSSPETRMAVAEEIKNIFDQMIQLANTEVGGSYIFAGYKTDTSPFTRDDDYNITYSGAQQEVTTVTCNTAATLAGGESFTLNSSTAGYYVWYRVDGAGADPALAGRTGILVDLDAADDADEVALKTASAIDETEGFRASSSSSTVTVTNDDAGGEADDSADNDTGFTVATVSQGVDGSHGDVKIIIGKELDFIINLNGDDIFTNRDGVNIFNILRDLKIALENNDTEAIQAQIEPLDQAKNQMLRYEAELGAKINRLESTEQHWEDFKLELIKLMSAAEDTDFVQAVIDLQSQQTAYQASLSTASTIIQKTLLDFLH
ncbi:MAG: flagellar hook-associated protein FlgL [Deltaproteobacteria bacterium]|nr:flagellar hook-associated protein FlgL [Deltaproteobacteria bacterium]